MIQTRYVHTGVLLASLAGASTSLAQAVDDSPTIANVETEAGMEFGPNVGAQPKVPAKPVVPPPVSAPGEGIPAAAASRFHLTLSQDFTNAYFYRGIRQEDAGFIAQPYADLTLDVFRGDDATFSLKLGTWNSFHGKSTGSTTGDSFRKHWYESDLYAGVGLTAGKWAFDARYVWLTSPSDAFGTVDEFNASVAFDDSEWLGAWSLKPTALVAVETGSNASDGGRKGTYLQLGISPGFNFDAGSVKDVAVTFPVSVGLSLSNYYEGTSGSNQNDAFGFASVGVKVTVPLPLDKSWGAWTVSAGGQALILGDATRGFNKNDRVEGIAPVGVSVSF